MSYKLNEMTFNIFKKGNHKPIAEQSSLLEVLDIVFKRPHFLNILSHIMKKNSGCSEAEYSTPPVKTNNIN